MGLQVLNPSNKLTIIDPSQIKEIVTSKAKNRALAMREFGVNSFRYEIIDIGTSKDDLELKEKYWIQSLCTLTPHGYNLNSGGSTKQKVTVDGIVFESKGKADQHIARTSAISL